jgi:hypothetical protein
MTHQDKTSPHIKFDERNYVGKTLLKDTEVAGA